MSQSLIMSASSSTLSPLLSTYDLKLACSQCSVKEKEVTYSLKQLVSHRCARSILLCRAKGGGKWRPISKRPAFPKPNRYEVCRYFKEGSGCREHRNRCTFARSAEEAAVWQFAKKKGLDHQLLCNLTAEPERRPEQRHAAAGPLQELLQSLDLKVVCSLCSIKEKEKTYTVLSVVHNCGQNLLLAKAISSEQWRHISERPTGGNIGPNALYKVCDYFVEGSGCSKHVQGQGCTYAKSFEEAAVWNYVREKKMDTAKLMRLVSGPECAPMTPQQAAEKILQKFSGEFMEFCSRCFYERPQTLAVRSWRGTCSADAAHTWKPVLVHHLSESTKHVYSQVRPLPPNCSFQYCSHVRQGKPCWHPAAHCSAAQSVVEMAVWKAESSGLPVRPHVLSQPEQTGQVSVFCKVCLLELPSLENFYKHCSSLEHGKLLSQDTSTSWSERRPPHNRRADFRLCDRPETCEYGSNCPRAHSKAELEEWMMRAKEEKDIKCNMENQGLMSYNQQLLEEFRNSSNEVYIMSEQVDDVHVSCEEDLTVECDKTFEILTWSFEVETERQLVHVALLKQEPGATFSLCDSSAPVCIYSSGEEFLSEDGAYDITVSFTSSHPGVYEQWLVLDFDIRPVLLKKLRVRVGQLSFDDTEQLSSTQGATFQSEERWHRGNRVIIPCSFRTEEQEELLKEYKPPHMSFLYKPSRNKDTPLNKDNYNERMHQFLYDEEEAEDQVVSRLNVCGQVTTTAMLQSPMFGMEFAPPGELYCSIPIPYSLTVDSLEGLVLKRRIQSALIAPLNSGGPNTKVYEANVVPHHTSNNQMDLHLSKRCCSDLALEQNGSYHMEVQFQLERHSFCTMHKAVDLLPDTTRVLPDLRTCGVPISSAPCQGLNTKQQSAVDFIMGPSAGKKPVAPLLIYGPFGTGKTFTLATAATELCKHAHNKVLICTHTNSSADLYVKVHFHPFTNNGLKPIRIKANKQGTAVSATDEITLKYCHLSEDRQVFLLPTKAVLDRHNVVIMTTSMAKHLHDLKLAGGYFTHILIDEASQMLECEALLALGLAGPNARVVLAGDHMQMGPQLFLVDDDHRSDYTLLTRLFHYYQGQKCDAAERSRIIFSENYRSTKEIVEFVSSHFYVGKNDVIKAASDVPAPADGHALKFHHVRGECVLDPGSMFWYNTHEIMAVVQVVDDIVKDWPSTWGPKDERSICILSEGPQVHLIRRALRRSHRDVNVENLGNVQGKQFRAVIMTAVQTRDSLKDTHLPGVPLFNDARVFNTAMTRAQSQVVVVGDAVALSCFGKCSGIWRSFINHCISNGSITPRHYSAEFFEKDVAETAKFQKVEDVDESNTLSDAILQELRDEYEQMKTEYSSDEDSSDDDYSNRRKSRESYQTTDVQKDLLELCEKQPDTYKRGMFVREAYNRGYFIPFNNPSKHISIQGRVNVGMAFTGDEVVISTERVISIIKRAESAREFVCFLEEEDYSRRRRDTMTTKPSKFIGKTMIPIKRSAPKICILILKQKRNFIPIYDQADGYGRIAAFRHVNEVRDSVFVVQVINWREGCMYPLGRVTNILSKKGSVNDRLWLLKHEFGVAQSGCETTEGLSTVDEDVKHRQDEQKAFTFTIDPVGSKDLDDAISIRDSGDHYELGIHISDVASFVSPDSKLDKQAKQRGSTHYSRGQEPIHMFPKELSTGYFSLLSGQDRRVVSLMFIVKKDGNKIIGEPRFQLSLINSDRQYSYEKAEDIISERFKESPRFDTVEDCVAVAYGFSKAQRKIRLKDWAYSQADEDRLPGKRKAHLMIEELSVLFNKHASEKLLSSNITRSYTPVRCQSEPNPDKVEIFKNHCGALVPLSFHVRHKVDPDDEAPPPESFPILTEVWKDIQSAARENDADKMVDLIAADDIHPLLHPVIEQFRQCSSKAYIVRYNSSPQATVGHYSLSLDSYTQASSPIRRYMDVILQRLLHSVICNREVQYSRAEITLLCIKFEQNFKSAKEFEQKTDQSSYAVSVRKQSVSKLAFVVRVDEEGDGFSVSFPFNKNIFPLSLSITYQNLQLEDQPLYDKVSHSITLKWRKRIYAADYTQLRTALDMMPDCGPSVKVPLTVWKAVIEAVEKGNFDDAKSLLVDIDEQLPNERAVVPQPSASPLTKTSKETTNKPINHWVDILLKLKPGDTLQVQITSEMKRCLQMPMVQLVHVRQKFEICVDHVHRPIICFYRVAHQPSKLTYPDVKQYVQIWEPLCKMESSHNAVEESESIIIEDLVVNFTQKENGMLSGTFFLPEQWITDWAIEFNLNHCLLCIRKRGLKLPSAPDCSAVVDPKEFTWVAHGVTKKVVELKNAGSRVEFFINHLPMEKIPDCVLPKNTFTVEIIPKLLPDIRKESAVLNLNKGCDLIKSIALGQRIPNKVVQHKVPRWDISRESLPGLPLLNNSQVIAVETALNNTFTLIQGPPGTGKTVVGVYIVYWFFKLNSVNQRKIDSPKDRVMTKDKTKDSHEVILYCGPSNKSVDVVAEYLMRFKESLRILRVYSQQVEMLDYPYPNCTLQFSSRVLRQDRSKPELRSITMHHRMREDTNPSAKEIRKFDERIRLGEDLTNEEVKRYKALLRDAREHELRQHDIILCTCTQSSTPSMTSALSARQILIDECGMATEPQTLIPLVCNQPSQIVLIGDHKQLRPIVKNQHVKKLGMDKSLFERYYTELHEKRTVMLDVQYRMHEAICKFPSKEFYNNRLKTGVERQSSVLRVDGRTMPVVFGHIKGETVRLVVKTAKGNNNSKANRRERDKAAQIAKMLVNQGKVAQKDVVVLSPYNAQVSEIREELRRMNLSEITVTTIIKSQGSEWRYVILSTVCSLPSTEIAPEPDGGWLSKHVGFVGDPNQINVAITRAKEGLVIIGNQKLLSCSKTWNHLLDHYSLHNAVTKANKISVC